MSFNCVQYTLSSADLFEENKKPTNKVDDIFLILNDWATFLPAQNLMYDIQMKRLYLLKQGVWTTTERCFVKLNQRQPMANSWMQIIDMEY